MNINKIREKINELSCNTQLVSVVMIVAGVALFVWPGKTLNLVAKLIGWALLLAGVLCALVWYKERNSAGTSGLTLGLGIAGIIAGILVLNAPRRIINIVPTLTGLAIVINGVLNVAQVDIQRKLGFKGWKLSTPLAIATIVLGIMIMVNPFRSMKLLCMGIGAILIYNGASNLWIGSWFKKN